MLTIYTEIEDHIESKLFINCCRARGDVQREKYHFQQNTAIESANWIQLFKPGYILENIENRNMLHTFEI